MPRKKRKKTPVNATLTSVEMEMAKPRMARSARIAERNLDTARVPDEASTTMPGTVADHGHRDLRIENSLTDENGDEVTLKKEALTSK